MSDKEPTILGLQQWANDLLLMIIVVGSIVGTIPITAFISRRIGADDFEAMVTGMMAALGVFYLWVRVPYSLGR